ncbi:hypothetical protein BUALT_Bualt07G0010100 [Buddleja alternifolia]|uniref:Thioredoxin domain-containing protein n=1 Tax=Buddleja alternifolia TaxID=168488 RepID=A0AAV6XDV0_9LAMI|nr:hypothetical protein BUALT_Bualt07G0010100 [Buddleja alternifolia]
MTASTKSVHLTRFDSKKAAMSIWDEDIVESEVEFDNSDVVEPDYDLPEKTGDTSVEVTEENREAAEVSKSKAMDAIFEGNLNEAIDHLTEAITLNPKSAMLHASRASVFVKLKKPNAAILDADGALQINPDLAKGHKARGMARALFGLWEEAARDLKTASKLDFDEETAMMLKKVDPNVKKIEEHRLKYERLRGERKVELERLRCEAESREVEYVSIFKNGQVIRIHSASELRFKLNAASTLFRLAIVYFTAAWCGPCRYTSPIYASLAGKYPKVVFLKVDIDEAMDVAAKWNVPSIPSFFFSKNDRVVDKVVEIDMNSLEKKIAQHAG